MGRHQDALAPAEEAVQLHRHQAAANPAYRPDLAAALTTSARLQRLRPSADALAQAEEAVQLRRELAAANPAFLPDLASRAQQPQQPLQRGWDSLIAGKLPGSRP